MAVHKGGKISKAAKTLGDKSAEEIACNLTKTAIENSVIHYSENSAEDIADFFLALRCQAVQFFYLLP